MRRKILIAEQADTVRSIAETVLRQNGYDVIAVTAAEKAREVLELSRPDLIIVGADLMAPDGTPYYDKLRADPRSAKIPVLFFQSSDKSELPFPSEVIIPRPFDPKILNGRACVLSLRHQWSSVLSRSITRAVGRNHIRTAGLSTTVGWHNISRSIN